MAVADTSRNLIPHQAMSLTSDWQSRRTEAVLDPKDWQKAIGLDWGTSQSSAGSNIRRKCSEPNPNRTILLQLQQHVQQVPQIIGWVKLEGQSELYWGQEFEEIIDTYDLGRDELFIFRHPKMFFFPSAVQDRELQRAEAELARLEAAWQPEAELTLQWLVTEHFKHLRMAAEAAVRSQWGTRFTAAQIDAMDTHWIITTPEISTHATDQMLSRIFKNAGFPPGIIPAKETEAAAAWQIDEHLLSTQDDGRGRSLRVRTLPIQYLLLLADNFFSKTMKL